MSETTTDAPATDTTDTTETQQPKPTETVEFWKQKAREQEKRAKDNASAAQRLAEIEDAQKSEAEKTTERLAAAERAADEARREATRYKIATEYKLAEADAAVLEHVVSEEGMRLVAARFAELSSGQVTRLGNVVPREGTPTPAGGDGTREFARTLFAGE
jgi:thioesterase domain-containing protein